MVVIERECLGSHPLLRRRLTTVAQPPASAHAVPDHVIRDGPKFKRRFNSITGLFFCLPTVFFTNCAVRRIAIAACALESSLLSPSAVGKVPGDTEHILNHSTESDRLQARRYWLGMGEMSWRVANFPGRVCLLLDPLCGFV